MTASARDLAERLRAIALDDELVGRMVDRLSPLPYPGATPHRGAAAEIVRQVLANVAEELEESPG